MHAVYSFVTNRNAVYVQLGSVICRINIQSYYRTCMIRERKPASQNEQVNIFDSNFGSKGKYIL
jgi:hypothetical protein